MKQQRPKGTKEAITTVLPFSDQKQSLTVVLYVMSPVLFPLVRHVATVVSTLKWLQGAVQYTTIKVNDVSV